MGMNYLCFVLRPEPGFSTLLSLVAVVRLTGYGMERKAFFHKLLEVTCLEMIFFHCLISDCHCGFSPGLPWIQHSQHGYELRQIGCLSHQASHWAEYFLPVCLLHVAEATGTEVPSLCSYPCPSPEVRFLFHLLWPLHYSLDWERDSVPLQKDHSVQTFQTECRLQTLASDLHYGSLPFCSSLPWSLSGLQDWSVLPLWVLHHLYVVHQLMGHCHPLGFVDEHQDLVEVLLPACLAPTSAAAALS